MPQNNFGLLRHFSPIPFSNILFALRISDFTLLLALVYVRRARSASTPPFLAIHWLLCCLCLFLIASWIDLLRGNVPLTFHLGFPEYFFFGTNLFRRSMSLDFSDNHKSSTVLSFTELKYSYSQIEGDLFSLHRSLPYHI